MEFIKTNFFDGPVMGKYRYTFSYDYDSDTVFNTPSTYDPVSNRWFSEFGYTYCTERGLSLAFDGDDMDMYWFWQKHHKDHIRETYYHWTYQDDAMTEVNITYTFWVLHCLRTIAPVFLSNLGCRPKSMTTRYLSSLILCLIPGIVVSLYSDFRAIAVPSLPLGTTKVLW